MLRWITATLVVFSIAAYYFLILLGYTVYHSLRRLVAPQPRHGKR